MELGYAHPLNKKDFSGTHRSNAAKAILNFADEIIELDPFEYAADIVFPNQLTFQVRDLKSVVLSIANDSAPPSSQTYKLHESFFEGFNSIKEEFVAEMTKFKKALRKEVNADIQIKNAFKSQQTEYIKLRSIDILHDIDAYLGQVHNSKIVFDDDQDMKRAVFEVDSKFSFYMRSKQRYIRNLSLEKTMLVQPNDFLDLHSLLYVQGGDQYWTFENRWKNIFVAVDLEQESYIP